MKKLRFLVFAVMVLMSSVLISRGETDYLSAYSQYLQMRKELTNFSQPDFISIAGRVGQQRVRENAQLFLEDLKKSPYFDYDALGGWNQLGIIRGPRGVLALAIIDSNDKESIQRLIELLSDKNDDFRRISAFALGHGRDPSYIKPLKATLKTERSLKVRLDIIRALSGIAASRLQERIAEGRTSLPGDKTNNAPTVSKSDPDDRKQRLVQLLSSNESEIRIFAAHALIEPLFADGSAVLQRRLASEDDETVKSALREAINWLYETQLASYEGKNPAEYGRTKEWIQALTDIESDPNADVQLRSKAKGIHQRWKANK